MKKEIYQFINKNNELSLNDILEFLHNCEPEDINDRSVKNFIFNKTIKNIKNRDTLRNFIMVIGISDEIKKLVDNIYQKILQAINEFKNIESSKNSFYYFGQLYDSKLKNDHLFFSNMKFKAETHHILLINHLFDDFNYEEIKTPSLNTLIRKIKEENPFIYNVYIKDRLENILKDQQKEKLRKFRNKILAHQETEDDNLDETIKEIDDLYSKNFLTYYSSILKIITEIKSIIDNVQFENDDFFKKRDSSIDELKNDYEYYKEIYIEDIFRNIKKKSDFYIKQSHIKIFENHSIKLSILYNDYHGNELTIKKGTHCYHLIDACNSDFKNFYKNRSQIEKEIMKSK